MLSQLRPLVRRQPVISKTNLLLRASIRRLQHGQNGPHKEYFQHPSQFPAHAYQLNVPPPEHQARKQPEAQPSNTPPSTGARKPPFIRRLIRSTILVTLAFALGWATGTAVITWDYLQPPFEPGSEEAKELIEDILETLETSPLVQDLREIGFQEEDMNRRSTPGKHMVTSTLDDVQGFKTKFFRHPEHTNLSVLVFFAGFGVEGFPEYVHGGAITTIMTETAYQHCLPMADASSLKILPSGQFVNITFLSPVRPAEIYAVVIKEESASVRYREIGYPSGFSDEVKNEIAVAHGLTAYLLSMDSFHAEIFDAIQGKPRNMLSPDAVSQETSGIQQETDSPAEETANVINFADINGDVGIHAIGQLDIMTKSTTLTQKQGEADEDYGDRLVEEISTALERFHRHTRIDFSGTKDS